MRLGIGVGLCRGGLPFDPSRLPDLSFWGDSRSLVTQAGSVSAWGDRAGSVITMAQATGAKQPTYNASDSQYGGLPSFSFDGVDDLLVSSSSLALGGFTIFAVARFTSNAYVFNHNQDGSNYSYLYGSIADTMAFARGATTLGENLSGNWASSSLVPRTVVVMYDGTQAGTQMRLNGVTQGMSIAASANPGTAIVSAPLSVFSDNLTAWTGGTLASLIVYARALSVPEIGSVESYLRSTYGHY